MMLPDTHNMHIAAFFKTLLSRKATGVSGGQNYCLTNLCLAVLTFFIYYFSRIFFFGSCHVSMIYILT